MWSLGQSHSAICALPHLDFCPSRIFTRNPSPSCFVQSIRTHRRRLRAVTPRAHPSDAERAFGAVQNKPQQIGSEYGEGFVQFTVEGGGSRLDVDTLNERLTANGAARMRQAMCPDEAYGMLFTWDDVVADTRSVQRRAWMRLAEEENLPWPSIERQLYDVRAERVIMEVLNWTSDWGRAKELSHRVATIFVEELGQLTDVRPGVTSWLAALSSARVPCAIVSSLPNTLLKDILDRMEISHLFEARVTAEDDCETLAQQLLSAALKLQRPPNCCISFTSTPRGIAAGHNATMKVVALQGIFRAYQLKQADLTCATLAELTVFNVRRLFALRGAENMDLSLQNADVPRKLVKTANGTSDE